MSLHDNFYEKGRGGPTNSIVLEYDLCKEYVVKLYTDYNKYEKPHGTDVNLDTLLIHIPSRNAIFPMVVTPFA